MIVNGNHVSSKTSISQGATSYPERALAYVVRGWHVFPLHSMRNGACTCPKGRDCNAPAKHPRIENGLYGATTDPEQIRLWWQQWPDANIGIRTGEVSGLVVIDIDPRHGGTIEALGDIPPTARVRTGSGGWHLYFSYPAGRDVRNDASGKIAKGVDVRGNGGYVVAPLSIHQSGQRYEWVGDNGVSPANLPQHLIERLFARPERKQRASDGESIPEGERNSTLASMAGSMRHAGFDEEEILAALKVANENRCDPPLDDIEVERIAASIASYEPGETRQDAKASAHPQPTSLVDIMAMKLPETRWAVQDVLPEGTLILGGKPKMGKSWLALGLALAIGSGGVALGQVRVEQGSVLYLALEDNARRIQDRVRKVLRGAQVPSKVYIATQWPRLDEGGIAALEEWLQKTQDARLIIIDTLAKVKPPMRGNGVAYQEDYAAIGALKRLSDERHVTILIVHHLRKMDADDPLDTLNGSTGIGGAADGHLILKRERGQADAVLYVGGRDVEDKELALNFDPTTACWSLVGNAEDYRRSKEQQAVIDLLQQSSEPMAPKDIAALLGESDGAIRQRLIRMAREGLVKAVGRGQYVTTVTTVTKSSAPGSASLEGVTTPVTTVTTGKGSQSDNVTPAQNSCHNAGPASDLAPEGDCDNVTDVTAWDWDAIPF